MTTTLSAVKKDLYKPLESYKDKGFYLYIITNSVNDKVYVGQTIQVPRLRKAEHWRSGRYNKGNCIAIKNAMYKHGVDKFSFTVICESCRNLEGLNELEELVIEELQAVKGGYNIKSGGLNHRLPEESRRRIADGNRGKKMPPEAIERLRIANTGKKWTDEQRIKFSESRRGCKASEETKKKMSATRKGKKMSPEWCANISKGQKGRKVSKKQIESMREIQIGHKYPDWVKIQRSFDLICKQYLESNKDKSHSIESVIEAVAKFIKDKEVFLKDNNIGKHKRGFRAVETASLIRSMNTEDQKESIRLKRFKESKIRGAHVRQLTGAKKNIVWLEKLKLDVENGNAKPINIKY